MPISIEKIPNAAIVVVHAQPAEGDLMQETAEDNAMISRVLDAQTEKVFLVTDMRAISMGLDDILEAATMSARGQGSLLHHPNIRENIFVLKDGLLRIAVKGLNNIMFGLLATRTFDTLEEALDYCRGQLGARF